MRDLQTIKADNADTKGAQERRAKFAAKIAAKSRLTDNWKADASAAMERRARLNGFIR